MKTYPLTQAGFTALRSRLLEAGVTLPNESAGELNYTGIVLDYHYDSEQQRLTLSIKKKPFLVPATMIWQQVDEWIGGG